MKRGLHLFLALFGAFMLGAYAMSHRYGGEIELYRWCLTAFFTLVFAISAVRED